MNKSVVAFERVSKKFRRGERHDSLRDLIPALVLGLASGPKASDQLAPQEFWAVRDVSFEVKRGEALGIIGRNGAGKSTTLKILNRIMKPTLGTCRISGRVGALIELVAGFHPDLTGRQNVYLQGALMGMRRSEVDRKFAAIVEFADIGEFIDTPVKRYSSGMSTRLGFAIAAHLDPDVLLIDEVLAVGDFAFQQKAFDRLREIVGRGVPTIVVSHQLERIASLCTHVLVLDHGMPVRYGHVAECIAAYVLDQPSGGGSADATGPQRLVALDITESRVRSGARTVLRLDGMHDPADSSAMIRISLRSTQTGQIVYSTDHVRCGLGALPDGRFRVEVDLQMNVAPGVYLFETSVVDTKRWSVMAEGPRGVIDVSEGVPFQGVAQLNARMRLLAQPAAVEPSVHTPEPSSRR